MEEPKNHVHCECMKKSIGQRLYSGVNFLSRFWIWIFNTCDGIPRVTDTYSSLNSDSYSLCLTATLTSE